MNFLQTTSGKVVLYTSVALAAGRSHPVAGALVGVVLATLLIVETIERM